MPPKARITEEMIVTAAFEIARTEGAEGINVRGIAQKLGCSTQPVLYCFSTISEIKNAAYARADQFHSEYITSIPEDAESPILAIGLNYIRFAAEEKPLFRFIFQSDGFPKNNLDGLIDNEGLAPVMSALGQSAGVGGERAKEIFLSVFLTAHGYASLLANNSMEYDEKTAALLLKKAMAGAVYSSGDEFGGVS